MAPRWKQSSWGYEISSIDELVRAVSRIGTLQAGRRYVWRGVVDRRFALRSSLIRHLVPPDTDVPSEGDVREREREILAHARNWGIGIELGGLGTDLHLLALLQHHGLPTRLLDVTCNPMTALWFACQRAAKDRDASGVLFAFDTSDLPEYPTVEAGGSRTYAHVEDPLGAALEQALTDSASKGRAFLVRPSLPDVRMTAQEGLFIVGATPENPGIAGIDSFPITPGDPPAPSALKSLFAPDERGPGRPQRLPFVALVIPSRLKGRVLRQLRGTYNRKRSVLFPDLAGFSDAFKQGDFEL
jgi:hypothetical protein